MATRFHGAGDDAPARNGVAITPADSDLANETRALYVGTGGDLAVRFPGQEADVVFPDVPSGALLPLAVIRVAETNTTADGIVAVW